VWWLASENTHIWLHHFKRDSVLYRKKSLKISKGQSESVNRRTDNTMVKRNKDRRTNNDLQNITYKTKDRVTRTSLKPFLHCWQKCYRTWLHEEQGGCLIRNRNCLPFTSTWFHIPSPGFLWVWSSCCSTFLFFCVVFLLCLSSFCILCPVLYVSLDCTDLNAPSAFSSFYLEWCLLFFDSILQIIRLLVVHQWNMTA
jgi:hypothetical protein